MLEAAAPYLHVQCDMPVGNIRLHADVAFNGGWTTLFGPSGSGKSSLLRVIAGLLRPGTRTMRLHGRELACTPTHLRRIGLVSQSPALFPHLSVLENITFGANRRSGPVWRTTHEESSLLLDRFEVGELARARPATLSGGETQRVALCRALLPMPRLLLLDESFSGLELALRTKLVAILRRMQSERPVDRPMPVIAVTHDVAEIFATADTVIQMQRGSILAQGTPGQVLEDERLAILKQLQEHAPGKDEA